MKLSVKLLMDIMSTLTPSPVQSRISMSSKTPGRDLEERCSLDEVLDEVLDDTFCKDSDGYYESSDNFSSSIKNIHVLQDSRKRLGG